MNLRAIAVLLFSLLSPQWVGACSIAILGREITFPDNIDRLSAEQVLSTTDWYIGLRDGWLGVADVMIYANSIKGDDAHKKLVEARILSTASLLKTLMGSENIPLVTEVRPQAAVEVWQFPEVVISVQPKCAATGRCCPSYPVSK